METQEGTELAAEVVSAETTEAVAAPGPEATAGVTPAAPTGINPAWAPLQEALGEDYFQTHAIPVLKSMDEAANSRITSLNSQLKNYEPYKEFIDNGVEAQALQEALQVRELLETNPQQLYAFLHAQYGQAAADEVIEDLGAYGAEQENAMEIPPAVQARLEAAEAFQRQILEQQQQQQQEAEFEREVKSYSDALDKEVNEFISKTPGFTQDDVTEIFRLRHDITQRLASQGVNRMATMSEVEQEFKERQAVYARRFGNTAPQTLPTTTGGNVTPTKPNLATMSKDDLAALVASDIRASQQ